MSADIEKLSVFDSRIVQSRPKYAVQKGALSVTNSPFSAIAYTPSQHTYNIYVPSENVFVDRAIEWSATVQMVMTATVGASPLAAGLPIAAPGRDFSLCAFPLNSLVSTLSATINDTTSVINTQDVLQQVLRLCDYKKNRLMRTCPTMLDKYQNYNDAFATVSNPLGAYDTVTAYDEVPNGAFYNLVFTDPTGAPLGAGSLSPAYPGAPYDSLNGVPVAPAGGLAAATAVPLYFKWRSTEKLVLSPFVFADQHEWDTGLFGINNIQLIMNLVSSGGVDRIIRRNSRSGVTLTNASYAVASPFTNAVVNVQFLTPSLDIPLPPKSVVPYMEFPRFISNSVTIPAGARSYPISSQTITLPQIPDLLLIYVKPLQYAGADADYLMPLASADDNSVRPISVNFDNFSGLLSSVTTEQLYAMSVKNGLDMDYDTWVGRCKSAAQAPAPGKVLGQTVPLVGGPLVLRMGQDITLQSGQAPSLVGNFTLQFNLNVNNYLGVDVPAQLYVITVNSGFFESIRGSSRIIKGVLSEQDIIAAPLAPMGLRDSLDRMVGGFSFASLGNILSKAKDIYERTKPVVSAIKGALPEGDGAMGKARGVLGALGYGVSGGESSGGRKKMSLEKRLM